MKKKKKGSGNGAVLHRMLRGSVRYFVICILSGVTFTALELVIPQILRLTVDSVIGDKAADLPARLQRLWDAAGHISARTCSGLRWRWQWWGFCRRRSGTR